MYLCEHALPEGVTGSIRLRRKCAQVCESCSRPHEYESSGVMAE